jgi:hypothetical protein
MMERSLSTNSIDVSYKGDRHRGFMAYQALTSGDVASQYHRFSGEQVRGEFGDRASPLGSLNLSQPKE